MQIKSISNSLMSISEFVSTQEQLDVILEGSSLEFEPLVTLINSKVNWFEFDEIKAFLLVYEHCVDKQKIAKKK